ncbi:MAG: histidinol phosphate phosphatase HisJ family protein, partial [Coprobacillus sp.]
AKEMDIPLELNLLGFSTKRHYPNVLFFVIAKKVGNRIIIGTDAHESEALLDKDTYDKAYDFIHDFGLEFTEDIKFLR